MEPVLEETEVHGAQQHHSSYFWELNKAVQRQTYQIPRLDDMLPLLKNSKLFSSLDGVSGYLQIPVHADSQTLLTFGTPFGRYCFQRLPFGICSTPELYQMLISQVLSYLPGHICYQDNFLIYAENEEEHDSRLCAILDKLRSVGLKLNKPKCKNLHFQTPISRSSSLS